MHSIGQLVRGLDQATAQPQRILLCSTGQSAALRTCSGMMYGCCAAASLSASGPDSSQANSMPSTTVVGKDDTHARGEAQAAFSFSASRICARSSR
jgi:hypothetical protein